MIQPIPSQPKRSDEEHRHLRRGSFCLPRNLPLSLQAKILRVLQDREITPIGSNNQIPVDIRLITATNKPIDELIKNNLFREDLYFRINTIEIELPSLRERGEDIILLSEYFLQKYSVKYEKPGLKITQNALDKLLSYHWPGNIRELKHTFEKAVILCESNALKEEDFFFKSYFEPKKEIKTMKLYEIEKEAIKKTIYIHRGNLSRVAKEMEMSRTTLYKKIKKYGL